RRLDLVGQRVRPAELRPDTRAAFEKRPRCSRSLCVNGAEKRVIRRSDDAQESPRGAVAFFQPAVALAVIAQAEDLGRQPRQVLAAGQVEQNRGLFGEREDLAVALERQQLQPAANGRALLDAALLANLDAVLFQLVLCLARGRDG